ncbi:MAG: sn-glycerol-1-phosphate dehydrogenase [Actinomycetaceae bacterium]|nr:sn-glycerol-1-phosphate dehydrogenase [Actinomycetaceae bacterium]
MGKSLIEQALETADETEEIVIGTDVLDQTGPLFARVFPGKKVIVVADDNTYAAAGKEVEASLAHAGVEARPHYIFPGTPTLYAGYDNVEILREHVRDMEDTVICSIASGSLNDIAKLASGELGRPYMNVCTAASVDGYASFGASISKDGFKITRDCPAPAALVADLPVIAAAPQRLTATGYGDLIEKIPAGADWILADELGIEPIDPYVWGLVQGPLMDALADPEKIGAGDASAIAGLAEGNIMSGLAMQAAKSSRPASGAGHQFSHVWEMEGHGLDWEPPLSHGFKVGVGTVASCAIWEEALAIDMSALDIDAIVEAALSDDEVEERVRALLSPRIAQEAVTHSVGKNLQGDALRARIEAIQKVWPTVRERVESQLISPEDVAARLKAVGAPYHPELIGIDLERMRQTHLKAQMIRPRYTILDALMDIGQFEAVVERLFSPEGYWGRNPHPAE